MMIWAEEKAWRQRRANDLGVAMDKAITAVDLDAFRDLYSTAMNYMGKKTLVQYHCRFIQAMSTARAAGSR